MNKDAVRNIIEATLKSGSKVPGLFELPKVFAVRSKLESAESLDEVVKLLENNRGLICKAFGLADAAYSEGVRKIQTEC